MRIVIATPLFPPELGSPALYVRTLAEKLKKDHTVTVVTYANHYEKIEGVRIVTVSKSHMLPIRLFLYTRELIRLTRSADILYTQRAVASGLPSIIANWFTKIPVVVNYIEDEAWERLQLTPLFEPEHQGTFRHITKIPGAIWAIWHVQHFVLTHAHLVLTPSEYITQELAVTHMIQKKNVQTLFSAPKQKLTLPFPVKKVPFRIFMNTSLLPWKDVSTAMRAVTLVAKKYPDVKLYISGEGPLKTELEEEPYMKEYREQTTFLGKISSAEELYYLTSAEVFLITATYEENPNILYDAFRESVPVVATNVPGLREGLEHKINCLVTSPGNADTCRDALEQIFSDSKLKKQLIVGGKKTFEEYFSWDVHVQQLLKYFKNNT